MIDGGPGYPVDGIKEQTPCELHDVLKNLSVKVAVGFAFSLVIRQHGMEGTFQLAMLVLGWIRLYRGLSQWSLTSLDLKVSLHLENVWVISFYGTRRTSRF